MSLCRTCFDICEPTEFSRIVGELKSTLKFCVPEVDLNITNDPVICNTCESSLKVVNEFKQKCLKTQQKILIFTKVPIKTSPKDSTDPPAANQKIVKKVAPFKLKFKKPTDKKVILPKKPKDIPTSDNTKNTSFKVVEEAKVKPFFVSDFDDNEQEDFLTLLDNSKNVTNPKSGSSKQNGETENKHFKMAENEMENAEKFNCELCDVPFSNYRSLNSHKIRSNEHKIRRSKAETGVYKCEKCSFTTKLRIGLNKHSTVCPRRNIVLPTIKKIPKIPKIPSFNAGKVSKHRLSCKLCLKKFDQRHGLAIHMIRIHKVALVMKKCAFCPYQATTIDKIRMHKKMVHPNERKHKSKTEKKSKEIEEEVKQYTCIIEHCGRTFASQKGLLIHVSNHSYTDKSNSSVNMDDQRETNIQIACVTGGEEKDEIVEPVIVEQIEAEDNNERNKNSADEDDGAEDINGCSQATIIDNDY